MSRSCSRRRSRTRRTYSSTASRSSSTPKNSIPHYHAGMIAHYLSFFLPTPYMMSYHATTGNPALVPSFVVVRPQQPSSTSPLKPIYTSSHAGAPPWSALSSPSISDTPLTDLGANDNFISITDGTEFSSNAWRQRRAMQEYTRMGVWLCITGRAITLPLTCYLVLSHRCQPPPSLADCVPCPRP